MNKKSAALIGTIVLIVIISLIIGLFFGLKNNSGENIVWDDNYIIDPNDVKIDESDGTITINNPYIEKDGFEPDVNSNINIRGEISFELTDDNNTEIDFILGGGKNGNGHELNNKRVPENFDHVSRSKNDYDLRGVGNFKNKLIAILTFLIMKKNHNGNNDVLKKLKLLHIWIEFGFYHPKFNNKPALSIHDFTLAVNSFITDFPGTPSGAPRYTWLLNKNAVILSAPYNIKYKKLTYTFIINTRLIENGKKSHVMIKTNNYRNIWLLKEKLVNNFMSVNLTQKK